jgi:hypothetical protein
MVNSFAFVVIKGPSLIKIISARNQDIIMVYEAVIKVDIYGVGHLIFETDALFMVSFVAKPVEFGLSYNFESLGSVIFFYEAVIKVDIYGVGLANTRAQP